MSNVLVTGVAGFIGSAVSKRLLQAGHTVVGVDNLSTGGKRNIAEGMEFIKGGCQDASTFAALEGRKFDSIIHLAAQNGSAVGFADPLNDLAANTIATYELLEFAKRNNCKRFILASSVAVYGTKNDLAVSEQDVCEPQSFYGAHKLASENYLRIYQQYGIDTTALRLFNVYGPGQNMVAPTHGIISIFMEMLVAEGHIVIKGSPNRVRDFIYIDDAVEAFMLCLDNPDATNRVFNISRGNPHKVGEVVDRLRAISKKAVTLEYAGSTEGDVRSVYADISLASELLGFVPKVSLEEGIRRMYQWYVEGKE